MSPCEFFSVRLVVVMDLERGLHGRRRVEAEHGGAELLAAGPELLRGGLPQAFGLAQRGLPLLEERAALGLGGLELRLRRCRIRVVAQTLVGCRFSISKFKRSALGALDAISAVCSEMGCIEADRSDKIFVEEALDVIYKFHILLATFFFFATLVFQNVVYF